MKKTNTEKRLFEFFCDRCESKFAEQKPLEKDPGDTNVERGVTLLLPEIEEGEIKFRTKDLCGKCVTDLDRWSREKPAQ